MNILNKVRKSGCFGVKTITKKIFSSFSKIGRAKIGEFLCNLYRWDFGCNQERKRDKNNSLDHTENNGGNGIK